ncbi:MAG TPA: hypothetical protein DHU96_33940 [Actinobacteria bacterium]|nr:hypothetical protein [Actinomycetota bacterium]
MEYGMTVRTSKPFSETVTRVRDALKSQGFGVLTEIDVSATMKKKLNLDLPPYRILGACNPHLASQAIAAEPEIGALLPCNVVVRQDAEGSTRVEFMDPNAVLKLVDRPIVNHLAAEVRSRLERVMAAL